MRRRREHAHGKISAASQFRAMPLPKSQNRTPRHTRLTMFGRACEPRRQLGRSSSAKEKMMKQIRLLRYLLSFCARPRWCRRRETTPAAPVRQFIDGFNSGNVQSAFAAYATGPITIVDEFAPHIWSGPNAAHEWADAYDKHAQATGVTDGKVTYGKPTRIVEDRRCGVRCDADGLPL